MVFGFLESFVQITIQKLDGSHNVTNDSQFLWKVLRKQFFASAIKYEKNFMSKEYCIANTMPIYAF